jgi:hypothetical protein
MNSSFTYEDLLAVLRNVGQTETAALFTEWRSYVEPKLSPLLPKIGARLIEKGLWSSGSTFTPQEEEALVYLRQMDKALKAGGSEACMALWRQFVSVPHSRDALAAIAA